VKTSKVNGLVLTSVKS